MLNAQPAAGPPASGVHPTIKFEQVVSGYLTDVNGKYKLRAAEVTVDPGGFLGEHQHRGPGIRYVTAGEVTIAQAGQATVYKAGDYFFEGGDVTTAVSNKGTVPTTFLLFELLPADLKGGSTMLPPK
jgi:quercetin dioxygenase-like cupin family protein